MRRWIFSFSVVAVLLLFTSSVFAGAASDSCEFKGYGTYAGPSSASVPVEISIDPDSVVVTTKTGKRTLSKSTGYTIANFDSTSIIHQDINEVFSMMFAKEVENIDKSRCSVYAGSDKHELFIVRAKSPEGTLLIFEYASMDPPEVYVVMPK